MNNYEVKNAKLILHTTLFGCFEHCRRNFLFQFLIIFGQIITQKFVQINIDAPS
jgi:hypothetical protein